MMINYFTKKLNKAICIVMLTVLGVMFLGAPMTLAAQIVKVPYGTGLIVNPTTEINPTINNVGDKVEFKVINDVVIDGKVVIKAGAPCKGEVTVAEKRGNIGAPAKIGVSLKMVQAVDGSWIAVNGTKLIEGQSKQTEAIVISILICVFALFMKGKDASIPTTVQINANTFAEATVNL